MVAEGGVVRSGTAAAGVDRGRWGSVPGPIKVFLAMDLLFVPLYLAGHELSASSVDWLWDLNTERSVPTWYSSMQLGLGGCLVLAPIGARAMRLGSFVVVLVAGCGLLLLSVDELVGLHERFADFVEDAVGERSETGLNRSGAWVLLVGPAFVAACLVAAYLAREQLRRHPRTAALSAAGLVVFAGSFAGLELLGNFVGRDVHTLLLIPAEEVGEMVGATLLVWAAYELLTDEPLVSVTPAAAEAPSAAQREPRRRPTA